MSSQTYIYYSLTTYTLKCDWVRYHDISPGLTGPGSRHHRPLPRLAPGDSCHGLGGHGFDVFHTNVPNYSN